jgi:hypothetical protein
MYTASDVNLVRQENGSYKADGGYHVCKGYFRTWLCSKRSELLCTTTTLKQAREAIASDMCERRETYLDMLVDAGFDYRVGVEHLQQWFGVRPTWLGIVVFPDSPLPLRTFTNICDVVAYMTLCAQWSNGVSALDD